MDAASTNAERERSGMYEAFFHLDRRPFVASPRTDHYFPARGIEQARQSLTRCISRCEGPGAIIGPSGTGKSLLGFVLAKQFRDKMKVVVVQGGRLRTRKSLLQNVLYELKQPFRAMDEDELRLSLLDHLETREAAHRRLLLIVDDAHLLRGQVLLDIAALCGHVREGEPVMQFVLSGGPGLEEKLAHPRLESLQQRIAARCYLQAFSYDETVAFIRAQVEHCGGNLDQVIAADAVNALYRASDGVPRLINQIGDHALLLAYLAKLHPVSKAAVEEAWSDLQQLPTPWQVTDHPAAVAAKEENPSIIEFGSLEEPAPLENGAPAAVEFQPSNPVFNVQQNLWTIESGLARLHDVADAPPVQKEANCVAAPVELPAETLAEAPTNLQGWEDWDESTYCATDGLASISLENDSSMPGLAINTHRSELFTAAKSKSAAAVAAPAAPKRIANPFEEQFEIEEVVNDGGARKTPASKLAVAPIALRIEKSEEARSPISLPAIDEDRLEQFDGVAVDWLNYQATSVVGMGVCGADQETGAETWNVINTDGTSAAAGARYDDREAILVENDQPPRVRPVKRQEFRQLFAKMRGEK